MTSLDLSHSVHPAQLLHQQAEKSAHPRRRRGRLLLIEEDAFLASSLTSGLRRAGYDVFPAADGARGLSLFSLVEPDLILLDLGQSSGHGLKALRELRKLSPQTPIVVFTDDVTPAVAQRAARSGAARIHRPFVYQTLIRTIEGLL